MVKSPMLGSQDDISPDNASSLTADVTDIHGLMCQICVQVSQKRSLN